MGIINKLTGFLGLNDNQIDDSEDKRIIDEVEEIEKEIENNNPYVEVAINEFIKEFEERFDAGIFGFTTYSEVMHEIELSELQRNKLDPQIKSTLSTLIYSVMQKLLTFTAKDETEQAIDLKEFSELIISSLETIPFSVTLSSMLETKIYYGFVIAEKVYKLFENKKYKFKRLLKDIKVKRVGQVGFQIDRFNNIIGIKSLMNNNRVYPLSKFLYSTFNPEFDNHYGSGVIEYVNKLSWLKGKLLEQYSLGLAKKAVPASVIKVDDISDPNTMTYAKRLLKILKKGGGAVVPSDIQYETNIESTGQEGSYIQAMDWIDSQIAKAILGNTLTNNEGINGTGSFAQSQTHMQVTSIYSNYLEILVLDLIQKQVIYPLLKLNFDEINYPEDIYPIISLENSDPAKRKLDINTITALTDKGFINPKNLSDLNKIRKMYEFSEIKEEQLQEYLPQQVA